MLINQVGGVIENKKKVSADDQPLVPSIFSKLMNHYTEWMETKDTPSWELGYFLKEHGKDYSLEDLNIVKNTLGFAGNIAAVDKYIKSRLIEIWIE